MPAPERAAYRSFAIDGPSLSRPHAKTLHDRSFVHQSDAAPGARPVTVGHAYSILVGLPEKLGRAEPPWAVSLSTHRVASDENAPSIAAEQVASLMERDEPAWHGSSCVVAADSAYGVASFPGRVADEKNLMTITRLRSNRVFHHLPEPKDPHKPGRPRSYGEPFRPNDPETHGEPDTLITLRTTTRRGRSVRVCPEQWPQLLMRGKKGLPMQRHPFTLVRITCRDVEGELLFRRPMWLAISGTTGS
jgi:hypothetical protein